MTYSEIITVIRNAVNAVNTNGRFTNIRNPDGSLDLDPPFPIVNLNTLRITRTGDDYNEGIRPWAVTMNFLKNDSQDNPQEDMEEIISEMFNLSETFLDKLLENPAIRIDNIQGTHERRPLQGQFSGFSLSFTIITRKQC